MTEYTTFKTIANAANGAAGDGVTVFNRLVDTATHESTVTAAILGGAGYYAYRKRNSE